MQTILLDAKFVKLHLKVHEKRKKRTYLKGTVSVISSDTPCKDGYADLQRNPWKLCRINYELDINVFFPLNC